MKKTIKDIDFNGKRVLVRVDFNVPLKDGVVKDDNRIKEALPTINYLLDNNAKVCLCSHLGKIDFKDEEKTIQDKAKNDMKFIVSKLEELLGKHVYYVDEVYGSKVDETWKNLKFGEVMLIQNTRYIKGETKDDLELAKELAKDKDVFVMDAFGSAHRSHSSTYGVAKILKDEGKETALGFLMEKEVNSLSKCVEAKEHPYVAVLGGAKVSDKIKVIESLLEKVDKIIIGGAMAYTFLASEGVSIGSSRVETDQLDFAKSCLEKANGKIVLPLDHVCANDFDNPSEIKLCTGKIDEGFMGLDIGPKTIELYKSVLKDAKIIFWNGPMGVFEDSRFANGTKSICAYIASLKNAFSVIGGGDSAAASKEFGYKDEFSHVSTGGGASLEMIENNGILPGIEVIEDK
jgi:phosphoglycerate kinase